VVADDQELVANLKNNLELEGYRTRALGSGQGAIAFISEPIDPDLMLLDIMLPDISGIEVCRRFRAVKRTEHLPIIIVTAKTDEIYRVVAFEAGADDFVAHPYSIRELVLRIRSLLQRAKNIQSVRAELIAVGRLRVDTRNRQVWVDDRLISLTTLEYRLLLKFFERRGQLLSRDTLLREVWDRSDDAASRTVDTHLTRLRQKLGPVGNYIETLRGAGYRLRNKDDA
jgi:two-component system phosphate regulon response regulator PhoB